MQRTPVTHEVGVIVGRFQVPELHAGHRALFDYVIARHRKVLVVLGCAPVVNSATNPLDIQARMQMVHEDYPGLLVTRVDDHPSDDEWSKNLDAAVRPFLTPGQRPMLYGSRDSFTSVYTGVFDSEELVQDGYMSGTEVRDWVRRTCEPNADFRRGVIWASMNRYPIAYPCVDIAILDAERERIVLGQHANGTDGKLLRLPGGFGEPGKSFEEQARAEVLEETHMGVYSDGFEFLGSFPVDDYRYFKEPDGIVSLLFLCTSWESPRDGDDLMNVRWVPLDGLREKLDKIIVPDHRVLIERVLDHVHG